MPNMPNASRGVVGTKKKIRGRLKIESRLVGWFVLREVFERARARRGEREGRAGFEGRSSACWPGRAQLRFAEKFEKKIQSQRLAGSVAPPGAVPRAAKGLAKVGGFFQYQRHALLLVVLLAAALRLVLDAADDASCSSE